MKAKRVWLVTGFLALFLVLGASIYVTVANAEKVVDAVQIEAGNSIEVSQFLLDPENEGTFITDLSMIDLTQPGTHEIEIQVGKKTYTSTLQIVDTTPPTAEAIQHEVWPEEVKEAKDFVTNVADMTDVSISFLKAPDYLQVGTQEVVILLEDTSGNQTEVRSSITIKADTDPPVITGVVDQKIYVGEKISYKKGVTVTDNRDAEVELVVDSSSVDLKTPGTYEVLYMATDAAGNMATQTAKITVMEKPKNYVSEEELNKLADEVLAKILTDDMTDMEKLWAIYKWTFNHIQYTGSSDKSNWMEAAVHGIKKGTGDCFNYYSTARILLTRAGFENMMVERVGGTTRHYWNLVKYDGNWYHFDTTWWRRGYPFVCFLRTDAEVAEYTKLVEAYYQFDASKYPATPTEPLEFPFELNVKS